MLPAIIVYMDKHQKGNTDATGAINIFLKDKQLENGRPLRFVSTMGRISWKHKKANSTKSISNKFSREKILLAID